MDDPREEKGRIEPGTRVADLLRFHPHLERTLLRLSPEFARLRSPVLRNTVARIATLRHAARIAKIPLDDLIRELRHDAGIADEAPRAIIHAAPCARCRPVWAEPASVSRSLDVRPILEAGDVPFAQALREAEALAPGSVLELVAPFVPQPLVEKLESIGFLAWSEEVGPSEARTYITRR